MKDYSLPTYDSQRDWIRTARSKGISWEEIEFAKRGDDEGLQKFLDLMSDTNWWSLNIEDWKEIVRQQKKAEEKSRYIRKLSDIPMIVDETEDGSYTVPENPDSSWQLYRKKLIEEKHFQISAVDEIENATLKILNRLHAKTKPGHGVKGLVIGNVQSGKTANILSFKPFVLVTLVKALKAA